MKTETLETLTPQEYIDANLVLNSLVEVGDVPEHAFRSVKPGEAITVPNYMSGGELVVPSLEVVTPRGHEARLVSLHDSDPRLEKLYKQTTKARKGLDRRIDEMTYDATVRILDTSGAEGLHHIHGTNFPYTVYHAVKRGRDLSPNVYVTRLGELNSGVPVLARVTATKDKAAEYKLFQALGAGNQKRKHTP